LRVFASKALANTADQILKRYTSEHPTSRITVTGGLISRGFPLLFNGDTDLAISSRPISTEETAMVQKASCELAHRSLPAFMIAVIVNSQNPLQEISLPDLKKIYSGEINNWRELGGFDEPIQIFGRHYPREGIAVAFTESVMDGASLANNIQITDYDNKTVAQVSIQKGSIGYARSDSVMQKVKTLALKRKATDQAVMPALTNLENSSYPLIALSHLYWNKKSPQAASAERCADYYCKGISAKDK
jgi:phosphate transport system substrate-binding protein